MLLEVFFMIDYIFLIRDHGVLDSDELVVATLMKLIECALLHALQDKLLHTWTSGKFRCN